MHPLILATSLLLAASSPVEVVVPSETCGGLFVVPLSVGDGEPLHLLLDTGASRTFVDPAAMRRLAGRPVAAGKVTIEDARLGSFTLGRVEAFALPMGDLGLAIGRRIDGILGFPAFKDVMLTLDYRREEVRLARGRLPAVDGKTVLRDTGARRPQLKISVDGRRLELLLDSGAHSGFLLKPKDRLRWEVRPRPIKVVWTYYGSRTDLGGRMRGSVRVGPLTFEDPLVTLGDRERLAGRKVMRHFVWTFDQRHRRIRMLPVSSPPVRMGSMIGWGVGLRSRRDGDDILAVFPDSPADAAGLRRGDRIVAVDGTPAAEWGCNGFAAGDAGRHTVTVLRDGVGMKFDIEGGVLIP